MSRSVTVHVILKVIDDGRVYEKCKLYRIGLTVARQ